MQPNATPHLLECHLKATLPHIPLSHEDLHAIGSLSLLIASICDKIFTTLQLPITLRPSQKDLIFSGLLHVANHPFQRYFEISAPPAWGKSLPFNILGLFIPGLLRFITHNRIKYAGLDYPIPAGAIQYQEICAIIDTMHTQSSTSLEKVKQDTNDFISHFYTHALSNLPEQPIYQLPWSIHRQTLEAWKRLVKIVHPEYANTVHKFAAPPYFKQRKGPKNTLSQKKSIHLSIGSKT